MTEKVQIGMLALMGVAVITLGTLVGLGHNSGIKDGLMALCGGSGILGAWEYVKSKGS